MTQMNFDLEDGKPAVSFPLKSDDVGRFVDFMDECHAATATLKAKGYSYTGGQQWRPPLGRAPDFNLLDAKNATIGILRGALEAVVGASDLDELKGMEAELKKPAGEFDEADRLASIKALQALISTAGVVDSGVVPGVMHCARCKFKLNRVTLYMGNGVVGAGNNTTEPCPNGCGPLWPVSWEQEARSYYEIAEGLFERADKAEKALAGHLAQEAPHAATTTQATSAAETTALPKDAHANAEQARAVAEDLGHNFHDDVQGFFLTPQELADVINRNFEMCAQLAAQLVPKNGAAEVFAIIETDAGIATQPSRVVVDCLREALSFQSTGQMPTIHDYGRWRRAVDAPAPQLYVSPALVDLSKWLRSQASGYSTVAERDPEVQAEIRALCAWADAVDGTRMARIAPGAHQPDAPNEGGA